MCALRDQRSDNHPDLSKPMYGLVEAVYPGRTWETFKTDVRDVTDALSGTFG